MIDRLIGFSLRNRPLILFLTLLLVVLGVRALGRIPIDAFPDVTNVQVQVISEAPAHSPVEVEKFVTFPIEVALGGLPGLTKHRSLSKPGLSVITAVFEDDVDIFFARQLVLERLLEARGKLPPGVEPKLAPVTTALGEIFRYTVEGPRHDGSVQDLMELRSLQDWIVRPLLKTVAGVADVNSIGGYVRQHHVLVDPALLIKYDLTLQEIFAAIADNNANAGGGILVQGSEQYLVRGVGLVRSSRDIEEIVVAESGGVPIYVKDVARVVEGAEVRQGAAVKDGGDEVTGGIVMMLRGGNALEAAARVREKVLEINESGILPGDAKIHPYYDRTDLVQACIRTVHAALLEGALLVVLVLYLFLRSLRGAFVVALTLPIAALGTFIVMKVAGLSANLMTLGGLAISIGMIVDAAIIQVENVQRHLSAASTSAHRLPVVLHAALEVRKPSLLGELIIAVTFLPLLTLQGMEGKLFSPLALTISIALFASLLLSIFVIPVLSSLLLKPLTGKEGILLDGIRRAYLPLLRRTLRHRKVAVATAFALLLLSLVLVPFLGTEFIPILDEGSLTPQAIRLPSISLEESIAIERRVQKALLRFPEVQTVVSNIGTAEIAVDPMGPNVSDPIVIFRPRSQWKRARTKEELVARIREELERIPGVAFNITQPIAMRVDELLAGTKSQIAVKLSGDNMDVLKTKAEEIAHALSTVSGVADLRVEQVAGQPYLTIEIDRGAIARYGINVADVQGIIEVAVGGRVATEVLEGDKRIGVLVRFPERYRDDLESIGDILIPTPGGSRVPLAQLARLSLREGPVQISREDGKRRIAVECNVRGRDPGGFVAEAQRIIRQRVDLPSGYFLTWGGTFENQARAMRRLMMIVPLTIALIFFLLFSSFTSFRQASLVLLNLPFALIGGIVALVLSGLYLSVPASVGFIALFGVAVLNGIVLVSSINTLRREGMEMDEAILMACELRLRPVLMTAVVAALGLIPLLFATGTGSEIQRPLATVVVGGLVTSTALTLLVLPAMYHWFEGARPPAGDLPSWS